MLNSEILSQVTPESILFEDLIPFNALSRKVVRIWGLNLDCQGSGPKQFGNLITRLFGKYNAEIYIFLIKSIFFDNQKLIIIDIKCVIYDTLFRLLIKYFFIKS